VNWEQGLVLLGRVLFASGLGHAIIMVLTGSDHVSPGEMELACRSKVKALRITGRSEE